MTGSLTIRRPDDWHLHVRDGAILDAVVPHTARQFARAIIMPNLVPPATTTELITAYRDRIVAAIPAGADFTPLMTAYLTDKTDPDDLAAGHEAGVITAAKLYPAGATTNSDSGVTDIAAIMPVLRRMAEIGMPLLVHGEVTDAEIDIFDREAVFIERTLKPLMDRLPDLKIVLEHITTAEAAETVRQGGETLAATITPHHLMINRTDIFRGGIRPHLYCLPIAKREIHRLAIRALATSGHPRVFLGTDSAPHPIGAKESSCGCAGIFSAPTAVELYAQVFEEDNALDRLESFASLNGPAFYGLPVNQATVTLYREETVVPDEISIDEATRIRPFRSGETLAWRLR
ncbi:dihydroorotase [Marivibrio halodurans]|uniref:Dihydroorotase n=1 Tax=Marivibrio halodurans TaxID=2039722 RepID=A0A8J7SII0_9PROT|nr:dihydroorotase [Marivibrio halodurans]MBP5857078.1 dihydroorotase [Marivibrio halodurans]